MASIGSRRTQVSTRHRTSATGAREDVTSTQNARRGKWERIASATIAAGCGGLLAPVSVVMMRLLDIKRLKLRITRLPVGNRLRHPPSPARQAEPSCPTPPLSAKRVGHRCSVQQLPVVHWILGPRGCSPKVKKVSHHRHWTQPLATMAGNSFALGLSTVASSAELSAAPTSVDRYSRLPPPSAVRPSPVALVTQPQPVPPNTMVTVPPPTATTVESSCQRNGFQDQFSPKIGNVVCTFSCGPRVL